MMKNMQTLMTSLTLIVSILGSCSCLIINSKKSPVIEIDLHRTVFHPNNNPYLQARSLNQKETKLNLQNIMNVQYLGQLSFGSPP